MALARAHLRTTPPQAARAAQAAWQAFARADSGLPEIPSLLLLSEAFRTMERYDVAISALEAAQERAPDDPAYPRQLQALRVQAGIQVRRVKAEPEADPPQACLTFTTAPARRANFIAGDWVRLSPAQPNAAVTREGDQICVAGLRLGPRPRSRSGAGMPGEDGLKLNKDAVLDVAMANRQPRLIFDSRLFLLPRNQAATVSLSSVNLSKVSLKLLRVSERNLVGWWRDNKVGEAMERYTFNSLEENGRVVWEGTAEIPHWQPNQVARTALPLPDAFSDVGAYVLLATPGTARRPTAPRPRRWCCGPILRPACGVAWTG